MFYEEAQISIYLNCKNCNERLDIPNILPCGATICFYCTKLIKEDDRFKCLVCSKEHSKPEEGFPINEYFLKILACEPNKISRGDSAKLLRAELDGIQKKIDSLSFGITNGVDRIKEHCIELKADVQLATETIILKVNEFNEKFIDKIDKYEKECIRVFDIKNDQKEEFNREVDEMKVFYNEWIDYLKQHEMNDKVLDEASEKAFQISEKGEKEIKRLDYLIFDGNMLRFIKNNNILDDNFLGKLSDIDNIDTFILSTEKVETLMSLIKGHTKIFNQNWKLLYRATRDGFGAAEFHAKCDNNPKTLVIIKSTNGYIFGGYTQLDWSGYKLKTDPKAYLFSLVNSFNSPQIFECKGNTSSVACDPDYGPVFGLGNDLLICNNSNIIEKSYSNPKTFSLPSPIFLAGSSKFLTAEIEVFLEW